MNWELIGIVAIVVVVLIVVEVVGGYILAKALTGLVRLVQMIFGRSEVLREESVLVLVALGLAFLAIAGMLIWKLA